jgi:hypothetical protein
METAGDFHTNGHHNRQSREITGTPTSVLGKEKHGIERFSMAWLTVAVSYRLMSSEIAFFFPTFG